MAGKTQRLGFLSFVTICTAAFAALIATQPPTEAFGGTPRSTHARHAQGDVTLTFPLFMPLVAAPPSRFGASSVWTTSITLPTHVFDGALDFAYSPQFNMTYPVLNRSRYDPDPTEARAYTLVVLENDFLQVSLMPQLGGRVYQMVHKASGKPLLYQNPVIKPSPWGPPEMGWWLAAGGIEWCLPVAEHGYEWGIPWYYEVEAFAGGVRVTMRDSDAMDRIRARIRITLFDSAAAVRIAPTIENPTAAGVDIQFWLNAMLAPGSGSRPGPDTRFVFSATEVTVHSTGDDRLPGAWQAMAWPIYNGVDWSRLGNWDEWFGYFQRPQAMGGFQAVYDEGHDAGVVRAYASGEARGAKFFAFGWANALPPTLYTDGESAYVEMHGGVSPQFDTTRHLQAGESLSWEETWFPAFGLGGLTWANSTIALRLERVTGQTQAKLTPNRLLTSVRIELVRPSDGTVLYEHSQAELGPGEVFATPWISAEAGVVIFEGESVVARYP